MNVKSLLVFLLAITSTAFAKDKFVTYDMPSDTTKVQTEIRRQFTQMGYVEDFEHTKQCSQKPKPNMIILRQTGALQSGIGGISRCVLVTTTENDSLTMLRVEVKDHMRGGLTIPVTLTYDAKWIHKEYDDAFAQLRRTLESTISSLPPSE